MTAGDFSSTVRAWLELEGRGLKVRSRALTTTLYSRLLLGDLFIHGIGGAKYDELTDELIRLFYGLEPPAFLVLTATLFLPLPHYHATPEKCRQLAHQCRDLHWNPQRHLDEARIADPQAEVLAQNKRMLAAGTDGTRPERRRRFRELRRLTEELRQYVSGREQQLAREQRQCQQEQEANEVLRRRDYAFCLYPESRLREFCRRFLES